MLMLQFLVSNAINTPTITSNKHALHGVNGRTPLRNVHRYNTRYASKQNLYVKKVRTNTRKQTIGYATCIIWDKVPLNLKELNIHQFLKHLKPYLLSEQHN